MQINRQYEVFLTVKTLFKGHLLYKGAAGSDEGCDGCACDVTCVLSRQRGVAALGGRLHHSPLQPDHRRRTAQRFVWPIHCCINATRESEFLPRLTLRGTDVFVIWTPVCHISGLLKEMPPHGISAMQKTRCAPDIYFFSNGHIWVKSERSRKSRQFGFRFSRFWSSFTLTADIKQRRDLWDFRVLLWDCGGEEEEFRDASAGQKEREELQSPVKTEKLYFYWLSLRNFTVWINPDEV